MRKANAQVGLIRAFLSANRINWRYRMYQWRASSRMRLCALAGWIWICAFCACSTTPFSLAKMSLFHLILTGFLSFFQIYHSTLHHRENVSVYFLYISWKARYLSESLPENLSWYLSTLSPQGTICMKCQVLFSGKMKKKKSQNICSLRQQGYSNILKNFTTKRWKFLDKNSDICFHISAQNIACGY